MAPSHNPQDETTSQPKLRSTPINTLRGRRRKAEKHNWENVLFGSKNEHWMALFFLVAATIGAALGLIPWSRALLIGAGTLITWLVWLWWNHVPKADRPTSSPDD